MVYAVKLVALAESTHQNLTGLLPTESANGPNRLLILLNVKSGFSWLQLFQWLCKSVYKGPSYF